jgi:endogenous inhibitor of DNA gyrase (YacG/DUF329 family)
MTESDAGKVVRAGLLELIPRRQCARCGERVTRAGHIALLSINPIGVIAYFFCSKACDTVEARHAAALTMKVLAVGQCATDELPATQPKGEA